MSKLDDARRQREARFTALEKGEPVRAAVKAVGTFLVPAGAVVVGEERPPTVAAPVVSVLLDDRADQRARQAAYMRAYRKRKKAEEAPPDTILIRINRRLPYGVAMEILRLLEGAGRDPKDGGPTG